MKTVYNPLELVSESEKQICKHQQQYKQLKAEYETLKLEQSTFAVTSSANIVKVKTNKKRPSTYVRAIKIVTVSTEASKSLNN